MANEKADISDIVKKCKILLLDIEGTTTSISFVKDKLFPYAEANVKDFLDSEWDSDNVKEVVLALRKLALEDEENKVDGVVTIPGEDASKEDQIDGLVKNVKWQMSSDRKVGPLKQLQGLIWEKGYDKGDIKGHVYDDVSPALELWRSVEGQKVYIYSSGSVQAQKLLFGLSSAGDMLKLIDGHFDTAVGAKQEAASYTTIAEKIGCNPEDILFLTDIDREAEAARSAGLQAALVSREGNAPLDEATSNAFPVLYSFAELTVTNKRKPDAQEEQPAKIPKTEVEGDVKTVSEKEVKDQTNAIPEEELEKMEVDEVIPIKPESPNVNEVQEVSQKSGTIVEEIADASEIADIPICDIEPVIVESPEKTETNETEPMENESTETINSVSEPKINNDLDDKVTPIVETPLAIITEIQDVTNDKEGLTEVVEMIDDLVPVIEEPPAQDMEELQNVGEVLAKECDEILSKVQNVTNLDNIPLKPLLNSIAEEVMETENTDSNDIVDNILDTELELEMKQCADVDINAVQKIAETKDITDEIKSETEEIVNNKIANVEIPEEEKVEKNEENGTSGEIDSETDPTKETNSPRVEEIKESISTEESIKEVVSTVQKTEESPTEEKLQDDSSTEAKTEENSHIDEKNEESGPTDEKIEENSTTEVKVDENGPTGDKIKDGSRTEVTINETSPRGDKMVESAVTEKQNVSSSPAEEKIEENTTSEDTVTESSPIEDKNILTDGIVKANCPADTQVEASTADIATQNKAEESSSSNMEQSIPSVEISETSASTEIETPQGEKNSIPSVEISETSASTEIETPQGEKNSVDEDITEKDEDKMDTESPTPKTDDSVTVIEENTPENRPDTQENNRNCEKSVESKEMVTDISEPLTEKQTESSMEVEQTEISTETKESDKIISDSIVDEVKLESTTTESKVNGNTTNGDTEMANLNGDASKEEELKSRLSMENGQEAVNGANRDSTDTEKANIENNGDGVKDVDMKVKTVAMDEPRNDPIEQPMEA